MGGYREIETEIWHGNWHFWPTVSINDRILMTGTTVRYILKLLAQIVFDNAKLTIHIGPYESIWCINAMTIAPIVQHFRSQRINFLIISTTSEPHESPIPEMSTYREKRLSKNFHININMFTQFAPGQSSWWRHFRLEYNDCRVDSRYISTGNVLLQTYLEPFRVEKQVSSDL